MATKSKERGVVKLDARPHDGPVRGDVLCVGFGLGASAPSDGRRPLPGRLGMGMPRLWPVCLLVAALVKSFVVGGKTESLDDFRYGLWGKSPLAGLLIECVSPTSRSADGKRLLADDVVDDVTVDVGQTEVAACVSIREPCVVKA